jgi:phosphatidate cytidylyltransferase
VLRRQPQLGLNPAAVDAFSNRLQAWWIICCLLAVAFWSGGLTVALFGFVSFWSLREFITLTPTRMGDHRALFWVFVFFTPMQYVLLWMDGWESYDTYPLYSILIPVFALLFIPLRIAMAGDPKRFLERVAKIQCGLLICVYCLSFAPALLYLNWMVDGKNCVYSERARLLFFFILLCLISEALQFVWGRIYGRHVVAPEINSTRTWEGLLGGTMSTALVGMALWWATPYRELWHVAIISMLTAVMSFGGAMTMSAIKRDRGVSDYGTLVQGHGGLLDRIDSICFAAPVFYHVTRLLLEI